MLFSDLLTATATWALVAAAAWVGLILMAGVLEAASAGRWRATTWVGCPPRARRLLLGAMGVALAASPAQASSGGTGLATPARPVGATASSRDPGGRVVVRPGDTLWHLASSRLPGSASAEEVAVLVERLHQRNRKVIGPDPNLIRPGQLLAVPHPSRRHEENP